MSKAYVYYFGSILLKLENAVDEELAQLWELKESDSNINEEIYYEKVLLYQNKILDVLNQPYISNVRFFDKLEMAHREPINIYGSEDEYLMRFSSPVSFDVELPINNRKYKFPIRNDKNLVKKFSVIYDGAVFLAYAPIFSEYNEAYYLAPEIRCFLEKTLNCEFWNAKSIPPCPIRDSFYMESESNRYDDTLYLKLYTENISTITYENDAEVINIMEEIFYENESLIEGFISIMSLKHYIEKICWEIEDNYTNVAVEFKNYYSKIIKIKLGNKIRKIIFNLYELLYHYDFYMYEFNKNKTFLLKSISISDNDSLKKHIENEIKINNFPQENILSTIKHIEETIGSTKSNYYGIIGAIIGALAAILTTILVG